MEYAPEFVGVKAKCYLPYHFTLAYNFFTTKINDCRTKNNSASTKFQTPKQMNSAPKKYIFHQNK
jgi:hypothetical protein